MKDDKPIIIREDERNPNIERGAFVEQVENLINQISELFKAHEAGKSAFMISAVLFHRVGDSLSNSQYTSAVVGGGSGDGMNIVVDQFNATIKQMLDEDHQALLRSQEADQGPLQ